MYYPVEWKPPYKDRRRACGLQLYSALNITREDKTRQQDQWAANYRAFEDKDAAVNSYRTPREDVHTFTQFFDDTDDKVESR